MTGGGGEEGGEEGEGEGEEEGEEGEEGTGGTGPGSLGGKDAAKARSAAESGELVMSSSVFQDSKYMFPARWARARSVAGMKSASVGVSLI